MKLIVCEKPKVAKTMASSLADGKINAKRINGINYYEIERNGEEITIVSAVGHVYTLQQEHPTRGYPVFNIKWMPAYKVNRSAAYTKAYVLTIEELAKNADEFISACDYDLEGSLIAYNVIRYACNSEQGKRMKFSALTKNELVKSYENMTELDHMNAYAGEARHILDWYYGINLSRALMQSIRKYGVYKVMSIGRVQGPALAILARRELKIKKFEPTPYWDLWAQAKNLTFMHVKNKFEKEEEMKKSFENSKSPVKVSKMKRRSLKQKPYPPFDLTSLQTEAYKVFKFQPSQVLQMAQTLYEASMISYPRTSSQKLPDTLDHKGIIEKLSKLPAYSDLIKNNVKKTKPYEGTKSDPAHPAIHPLGTLASVGKNEMKLYDLIVKRYLSCFGEEAKREDQEIIIKTNSEEYSIKGRRTIEKGWFEIYEPYLKLKEITLPELKVGEEFDAKFGKDKKMTKPPNRYTPASIISTLEKKNLGTKATRSTIIETLYKRGYVDGKSIEVTPFGLSVYDVLNNNCSEIIDEKLTEHFEKEMENIQEGKTPEYKVIEEGKETLIKILEKFKEKESVIGSKLSNKFKISNQNVLGKCPNCGEELIAIKSRIPGKQFVGCKNYPKCSTSYPLPGNALIEATDKICEKCKTPIVKVVRKGKKPFEMCLDVNCETKKDWGKYTKKPVSKSTSTKKTGSKTTSKKQKK